VNLAVGGILFGAIAVIGLISLFWTPFTFDDTSGGRLQPPSAERTGFRCRSSSPHRAGCA